MTIKIRLAEQIEADGTVAGGKDHALRLHDLLEDANELVQSNRAGERRIVFILDRDIEDFLGTMRTSPHVIYTSHADVEAEILVNSDVPRAVCSTHGLAKDQIESILPDIQHPLDSLALIWRDWIQLRYVAALCGVDQGARFGNNSEINKPTYGPVDTRAFSEVEAHLKPRVGETVWSENYQTANEHVDAVVGAGRSATLVKGKWASSYVLHVVRVELAGEAVKKNVQADGLVSACLETLDFTSPWTDHFEAKFRLLMAPQPATEAEELISA